MRSPVSGVDALNRELRTDRLVASRYSRLLRLSPAMVRTTFAQLHLMRLQKDMILEVHYVHAGETIGAKVRRVRKGTAVFALPNGIPVLAQVCGNPLRGIRNAKNRVNMLPAEVRGASKFAHMAPLNDIPDFDPTERLNSPTHITATRSITMRDAVPAAETIPDPDKLAPDEIPANAMETGEILPAQTIAQAASSLSTWVGGGAVLAVVGALGVQNVTKVVGNSLLTPDRPANPRPLVKPAPKKVMLPALTPEPNSILLAMALTAAALAHFGLRRRKAR